MDSLPVQQAGRVGPVITHASTHSQNSHFKRYSDLKRPRSLCSQGDSRPYLLSAEITGRHMPLAPAGMYNELCSCDNIHGFLHLLKYIFKKIY